MLPPVYRLCEVVLGLFLLLLPIALFAFVLDGVYAVFFAGRGTPFGWDVLLPRFLFFLISLCFWRIGRKLVSGQKTKGDGGLLPRGMLKVIEPILSVAAIALSVSRRMAGWGGIWSGPIVGSEEPQSQKNKRRKQGKRRRRTA
jgi:hypothetical protein